MTCAPLTAPAGGSSWVALSPEPLPVAETSAWVVTPSCGAVVTFTGTARDHAPGRPNVTLLEYEAYEEHAVGRIERVIDEARVRWPAIERVAALHRVGTVLVGQPAVVVAVASPHRAEAFEAARFVIDELKRTTPMWKREVWEGGDDWGLACDHLVDAGSAVAAR